MVINIDGEIYSDLAIHPGELLGEELAERGISVAALAKDTGCPVEHITDVIEGRAPFDAPLSVALERVLRISARFWMNLQVRYELTLAYQAAEEHRRVAI
jgi:addiction module HigA family antidote